MLPADLRRIGGRVRVMQQRWTVSTVPEPRNVIDDAATSFDGVEVVRVRGRGVVATAKIIIEQNHGPVQQRDHRLISTLPPTRRPRQRRHTRG